MRKWKQMLSIILVAVMMSGLIPQTAYATVSDNSLAALEQEGPGISNNDLLIEPNKEIVSTDTLSGNDDATISSNAPTIVRIEVSGNNVDYEKNEVSISCLRGMEERVLSKVNFYAYFSDGQVKKADMSDYRRTLNFFPIQVGGVDYNYSIPLMITDSSGVAYKWEERPKEYVFDFSEVNIFLYDDIESTVLLTQESPEIVPTIDVTIIEQFEIDEITELSSVKLYRNMNLEDAGVCSENCVPFEINIDVPYTMEGQNGLISYSLSNDNIFLDSYDFEYVWNQDKIDTSKSGTYEDAVRVKLIPKYDGVEGIITKPIDLVIKEASLANPVITYNETDMKECGIEFEQKGSVLTFISKPQAMGDTIWRAKIPNYNDFSTYDPAIRKYAFSTQKNGIESVSGNYLGLTYTIEKPASVVESDIASILITETTVHTKSAFLYAYSGGLCHGKTIKIPISDLKEKNLSYFQYDNGAISFRKCFARITSEGKYLYEYYNDFGVDLHGRYLISYLDAAGEELAAVPIDIIKKDIYESVPSPLSDNDIAVTNATSIGGTGTLTVDCKSYNNEKFDYYDTKKQEWITFSWEDDIDKSKNGITIALESGRSYSVRKYVGLAYNEKEPRNIYYPETPGVNFVIRDVLDFRVLKNGQTIEQAVAEMVVNRIRD